MADHDDDFGSGTPSPAPSPEGEAGGPDYGGEPGRPSPDVGGEVFTSPEAQQAPFKHPHPAADVANEEHRHPVFPLFLGAAMIVSLIVAWILNAKPAQTTPDDAAAAAAATPSDVPSTTPPAPEPTAAADDGVKDLRGEVDGLKAELKAVQERLEGMSKPDLGPINARIDELAKTMGPLASLPKKVGDIDAHLGSLDKSLAAQRGDLDALKAEVKKGGAHPTTAARPETAEAAAAKPEDVNVADASMSEGVQLLKAKKYKEAHDIFKKLTDTNPDDARVWYYAALSRGLATNQWTGETTRLVEKGVEREKAGSPDSAKIDSAFADQDKKMKDWLDFYRKSARSR